MWEEMRLIAAVSISECSVGGEIGIYAREQSTGPCLPRAALYFTVVAKTFSSFRNLLGYGFQCLTTK
jgi:hypothetical protein